jgi:hypothetical protein
MLYDKTLFKRLGLIKIHIFFKCFFIIFLNTVNIINYITIIRKTFSYGKEKDITC